MKIKNVIYVVLGGLFVGAVAWNVTLLVAYATYVMHRPVEGELLYGKGQARYWQKEYLKAEPKKRLQQIVQGIDGKDIGNDRDKIEAVATYLMGELNPVMGVPSLPADAYSGTKLFEQMREGGHPIWPSALARVYVALANGVGVPSRLAQVDGRWVAESFLAEDERWMVVDLGSRVMAVEDVQGRPISLVELTVETRPLIGTYYEGGGATYHQYQNRYKGGKEVVFIDRAGLNPTPWRVARVYLMAPQKAVVRDGEPYQRLARLRTGAIVMALGVGALLGGLVGWDLFGRKKR